GGDAERQGAEDRPAAADLRRLRRAAVQEQVDQPLPEREEARDGEVAPQVRELASSRTVSYSRSVTGCTDSRPSRTRAISWSRFVRLISSSETARGSFSTARRSTMNHVGASALLFGSKCGSVGSSAVGSG